MMAALMKEKGRIKLKVRFQVINPITGRWEDLRGSTTYVKNIPSAGRCWQIIDQMVEAVG